MNEFPETAPRQRAFILRFWETRSEEPGMPPTWHCSALDPDTGERRGFAGLDGLMDFLAAQTGQAGPANPRRTSLRLLESQPTSRAGGEG